MPDPTSCVAKSTVSSGFRYVSPAATATVASDAVAADSRPRCGDPFAALAHGTRHDPGWSVCAPRDYRKSFSRSCARLFL